MTELEKIIADSKKEIRKMKKTIPYIFPEYDVLMIAKRRLQESKKQLEEAKRNWNNLGK